MINSKTSPLLFQYFTSRRKSMSRQLLEELRSQQNRCHRICSQSKKNLDQLIFQLRPDQRPRPKLKFSLKKKKEVIQKRKLVSHDLIILDNIKSRKSKHGELLGEIRGIKQALRKEEEGGKEREKEAMSRKEEEESTQNNDLLRSEDLQPKLYSRITEFFAKRVTINQQANLQDQESLTYADIRKKFQKDEIGLAEYLQLSKQYLPTQPSFNRIDWFDCNYHDRPSRKARLQFAQKNTLFQNYLLGQKKAPSIQDAEVKDYRIRSLFKHMRQKHWHFFRLVDKDFVSQENKYQVSLFKGLEWRKCSVKLGSDARGNGLQIWPILIEQAISKKQGDFCQLLQQVLGCPTLCLPLRVSTFRERVRLQKKLARQLRKGNLLFIEGKQGRMVDRVLEVRQVLREETNELYSAFCLKTIRDQEKQVWMAHEEVAKWYDSVHVAYFRQNYYYRHLALEQDVKIDVRAAGSTKFVGWAASEGSGRVVLYLQSAPNFWQKSGEWAIDGKQIMEWQSDLTSLVLVVQKCSWISLYASSRVAVSVRGSSSQNELRGQYWIDCRDKYLGSKL